jgi:hypothetical protein
MVDGAEGDDKQELVAVDPDARQAGFVGGIFDNGGG